ncbi:GtrA family protein [Sphingomonas bacterium]|uniref:GtrA family protein n=1 Tax=Sphingomonas bacterium TaxID=1895847 RepID=UPI0015765B37|nr:GtrA family protein [Sphingomonas bacterium]
MPTELARRRLGELIRFYQAAAINTAVGFGLFALLIRCGTNLYVAQGLAQIGGVAFNYLTYSRHVFRDQRGSKRSFALAYLSNYLVNLLLLAAFERVTASPYAAGLAATLGASAINYLALRSLVFRRPRSLPA